MKGVAFIVWALVLLVGATGHGEESDFQRGLRHYTHGEYAEAIKTLKRASRGNHDPKDLAKIFLYLGLSQAVVGHTSDAEQSFVTAMTHDPLIAPDPFRIKPDLVSLFDKTRQRQRATLRVVASQADAQVLVDGKPVGQPPLRLSLPIGTHRVEVRSLSGHQREKWKITLPPGGTLQVSARLAAPVTLRKTPVKRTPKRRRLWTWVTGAAAVASAAVAGGLWASVQSDLSEYNDPATPDPDALAMEDPIRRKTLATNVMIGLGATLAVTAVVLYLVEGRHARGAQAPSER